MTIVLLIAFLSVVAFRFRLRNLNQAHLRRHGHTVPPELEGAVDPALLSRISDYTVENDRLGLIESVIDSVILVVFLLGGLLGLYDRWIASLTHSFLWNGVLFV